MSIQFRKADKAQSKVRIGLFSPSGFGKTYSALRLAKGLGGKVAVLDTERGSADLYANDFEYDVLQMNAPYEAKKYMMAIEAAEEAGYGVFIIDSLSHAWAGEGGMLDKQGKIADKTGNSWAAWRKITPDHNQLIDKILQSKMHIIVTARTKTDWVVEGGKPTKVGLAPIFRDGLEYELTCVFDLDKGHNGHSSKDRTKLFDGSVIPMTEKVGEQLLEWLEGGEPAVEVKAAE